MADEPETNDAPNPLAFIQGQQRPSLKDGMRTRGALVLPNKSGKGFTEYAFPRGPGDPGYANRIPPPPCVKCNEDHVPGRSYGHEYVHPSERERPAAAPSPSPAAEPSSLSPGPPPSPAPASGARLVVSFGRREGTVVVGVERPPDWEIEESYALPIGSVADMLPLLRQLGIRVKDLTGGALREVADGARAGESDARGAEST